MSQDNWREKEIRSRTGFMRVPDDSKNSLSHFPTGKNVTINEKEELLVFNLLLMHIC